MKQQSQAVLVLQGGGALGAYQAGVYEALEHAGQAPSWIAGISIGAINAALIAGNAPEHRVARLREFWELVTSGPGYTPPLASIEQLNDFSATQALVFGVPGFFTPRVPPPLFELRGTPAALSFYDTEPLRETLQRLVDFDRLNSGEVRLAVGAVNVRSGNFAYFDTASQRLDVRHILASGALPPGFPPVEIDGECYWDGGLVSNTPLQYVLDQPDESDPVVFQVDLFPARGTLPATIAEVAGRDKDIRYSSRTRQVTTQELQLQAIAKAAQRLLAKLPPQLRDDPDAQALAGLRQCASLDVVHLIYRSKHPETQAKDYEFSRRSMEEHWASGRADMQHTLRHPQWLQRPPNPGGVRVFDLVADPANGQHRRREVRDLRLAAR
ncbi:patatin-like phospholipase family protein [Ramlibacter agri]|nr:patatin-like phospholipase family protein [Ramlibacter agri]